MIYTIESLHARICKPTATAEVRPGVWWPARYVELLSLRQRIRQAWLAFTGRGDVVLWQPLTAASSDRARGGEGTE